MRIKSKQPKKQRKALFNAKSHQRTKLCSAKLADFLSDEFGIKRIPVRKGDSCRIIRGEYTDLEGEIIEVDRKNQRVKIKEAQFEKVDGTSTYVAIHTSKVIVTKFAEGKKMDPWRAAVIERKAGFLSEDLLIAPKKGKKLEEEKNK